MSKPPVSQFSLPSDADLYISDIRERCGQLLTTGIWEGIHRSQLEAWWRNFQTHEEQYFAASILDSMIYRSAAQTDALVMQLFEQVLPSILWRNGYLDRFGGELLSHLRANPDDVGREVVMVPVLRRNDPPTKSGPLVARIVKRALGVNESHMLWPWQIKDEAVKEKLKLVIFLDDFVGTGRQFTRFVSDFNLSSIIDENICIYLPFVAHEKGWRKIVEKHPRLLIGAAEHLTSKLDLFSTESRAFNDGVNSPASARAFHQTIVKRMGIQSSSIRSGFGRLGLAYSFHHATPNNSIPILWYSGADWNPLFTR